MLLQVNFVVLHDQRNFEDTLLIREQVLMQLVQRTNVFFPLLYHRISHKNNSVNTSQYKFPGGIVFHLTGYGVELDFYIVTFYLAHIKGQKIKKKGPVAMGF